MKAHRMANLAESVTEANDPWAKVMSPDDLAMAYKLFRKALGRAGGSKSQKDILIQLNSILNKYKLPTVPVNESIAPAQVEAVDPDGEMALSQLKNVVNKATALTKMIQPNSKLEPWVQSKITLADDYITTIHDYLKNTPGAVGESFEDFEEGTLN